MNAISAIPGSTDVDNVPKKKRIVRKKKLSETTDEIVETKDLIKEKKTKIIRVKKVKVKNTEIGSKPKSALVKNSKLPSLTTDIPHIQEIDNQKKEPNIIELAEEYVKQFSEQQRLVEEIAKEQLGDSYEAKKCTGFKKWLQSRNI